MKSTQFPILIVLVLSIVIVVLVILTIARPSLFQPDIFVQGSQELSLPEGAKARFGIRDIHGVAYSPDSSRLAVASSIGILIHDAQTGEELRRLKGHRAEVYSVAFSPEGTTLASGSGDDTIRLWDAAAGEHKQTLKGHTTTVYGHSGSVSIVWHSVLMAARLQVGVRTPPSVCGMSPQAFTSKRSRGIPQKLGTSPLARMALPW